MLREAAARGHAEIIKILVNYSYAPGATPWSARRGYTVDLDEMDGYERATPLALAAKGGHESAVRLLLDLGASVDVEDFKYLGLTLRFPVVSGYWGRQALALLGCAAYGGELRVVRMLVEAGCRVDCATRPWIVAPVVVAAQRGYCDVIAFLLDAPPDYAREEDRATALDLAAKEGNAGIVRLLVDRGMVPTSRTLNSAVRRAHRGIVEYLLCQGATSTIKCPLIAARAGQPDIVDTLMQHVKYAPTVKDSNDQAALMYVASVCGYVNLVNKYILKGWGLDQHVRGQVGVGSPLVWAAKEGHTEIIRLLLNSGADPHGACTPDCGARALYPLRMATERGHAEIVEILLDHGANPNFVNRDQLVVYYAIQHEDIYKLLLDRGADPNTPGKDRRNALSSEVVRRGTVAEVRMLLDRGVNFDRPTYIPLEHQHYETLNLTQLLARAETARSSVSW